MSLLRSFTIADQRSFSYVWSVVMNSPNSPSVTTLAATSNGGMATFNGQGVSFRASHDLEVWYYYGQGAVVPTPALESPHQIITSLSGNTLIPGFDVTKACQQYSYQVCPHGNAILDTEILLATNRWTLSSTILTIRHVRKT